MTETTSRDLPSELRTMASDAFYGAVDPRELLSEAAERIDTLSATVGHLYALLQDIEGLDPTDTEMGKAQFRGKVRDLARRRSDQQIGEGLREVFKLEIEPKQVGALIDAARNVGFGGTHIRFTEAGGAVFVVRDNRTFYLPPEPSSLPEPSSDGP